MPAIKKESFGTLSDGQAVSIYTLRNTKGNELKVTDYGARVVSLRFRNKNFENKFVLIGKENASECEKDDKNLGVVYVDDSDHLSKKIWNAEQSVEGVKFSIKDGDKEISVLYSISNDNEISIKYEAKGIDDVTTSMAFSGDVLANPDFKIFSDEFKGGSNGAWAIIDKPAEVEMELGMFGFDIGCPIDYLDAGLKNAADIVSEAENIALKMYATQNKVHVDNIDGGFAIKTSGTKSDNGILKSQTVYVLKNKN